MCTSYENQSEAIVNDDNAREYSAAWMDSGVGSALAQYATTGTADREEFLNALRVAVLPYISGSLSEYGGNMRNFYASWCAWAETTDTLTDETYYMDAYVCECCYYNYVHNRCSNRVVNVHADTETTYQVGQYPVTCAGCGVPQLTYATMYPATVVAVRGNN